MAHEIWIDKRGQAAFFVGRGIPAWHGLGNVVDGVLTWSEAIKAAGLDWSVEKQQLFDQNQRKVDAYGIFRDDGTFLGAVGERYIPIQNKEAFSFVDNLIGVEGAHYDSAGALGNGERIFVSAHLPSAGYEVVEGDEFKAYLMLTSSHDGSGAQICGLTNVRTVCQNTLNIAIGGMNKEDKIKIKHTKNAANKMKDVAKLVGQGRLTAQTLRDKFVELTKRRVTKQSLESVLNRIFPNDNGEMSTKTKNNVAEILNLYDWNDGNMFPKDLANALTEWTDKIRTARNGDAGRAESALFGSGADFKQNAIDILYEISQKEMPEYSQKVFAVPDSFLNVQ